jgi:hypothetical protein
MKTKEEIEQLAENLYFHVDGFEEEISEGKRHYILGYTQCQKDMVDKKYTEDNIYMALEFGRSHSSMTDKQFIESLNKQD